jgi:hypothetical protein
MTGSAASLISDAEAFGIILEVRGDKLRCGSSATMPPALRDMLREHKPDIIKELERRAASFWRRPPAGAPGSLKEGPEPITPAAPAATAPTPPMDSPPPGLPLAVSRALEAALAMAERCHVAFWLDEHGLLITRPPRDYRREVQAAERALMERREEIKTICCWPRDGQRAIAMLTGSAPRWIHAVLATIGGGRGERPCLGHRHIAPRSGHADREDRQGLRHRASAIGKPGRDFCACGSRPARLSRSKGIAPCWPRRDVGDATQARRRW